MLSSFDQFQRRRLLSSYFSVVLIISLVLFLTGVLLLLLIEAKGITDQLKEKIALNIFIKEHVPTAEITQLQKQLMREDYTLVSKFVSKEEAAKALQAEIGEDFVNFLGHNPLRDSIDLYLKAAFVTQPEIERIANRLSTLPQVLEVSYDKPLITLLNENVKKISISMLAITAVFAVVFVLVINSSIRLYIYSHRFTIKTMQLVGAGKSFIRRPFIRRNVKLAVFGSLIASAAIGACLFYLNDYMPELNVIQTGVLIRVFGCMMLFGIFISWLSTYLATRRFLNLQTDDLYL